ncbi:MAG: hypothetical protein J6T10_03385 [Methanobrevibacter sp.]|nr:hypothetical protein [Methanobrevibacter sp.]
MLFEYVIVIWSEVRDRTERKYGIVSGRDTEEAMTNLGKWYNDEIICIEYFGSPAEDIEDTVYELNDNYADNSNLTGRKFGKIIPPLNEMLKSGKIYE